MNRKLSFLLLLGLLIILGSTPKKITWVAIGDSITYLNDHPEETGNRITKGYLSLVNEKFPNLEVVNKGYNGWTAVRIATDFEKLQIPIADVYSIFLGTNDWWGGKPLGTRDDYRNNTGIGTVNGAFRVIIDRLRVLNPKAEIIFITPMKRVDFVYINNFKNNAFGSYREKNGQNLEQFVNAIREIAKLERLTVVDLYHHKGMDHVDLVKFKQLKDQATGMYRNFGYPEFIDVPFDPEKDEYPYPVESIDVTYDGLHPSDKGYQLIAKELYPLFRKLIKKEQAD